MNQEARQQVKVLLSNFLYGFYIENISNQIFADKDSYKLDQDTLDRRFQSVFMETQQQVIQHKFQPFIKRLTEFFARSLKQQQNNNKFTPELVVSVISQIFALDNMQQSLNFNEQSEILKLAMVLIHEHISACLNGGVFSRLFMCKNMQQRDKNKPEIISILQAITDHTEQEIQASFQEKLYNVKRSMVNKPYKLTQYQDPRSFSKQQTESVETKKLQKQIQKLNMQIEKLRKENQELLQTMKGYQKIKQNLDEFRATIDRLKEENKILRLKHTSIRINPVKLSDHNSSSKHSEQSGNKSLMQHISEQIKKHDTNSSIQSEKMSHSDQQSSKQYSSRQELEIDNDTETETEDLSINFTSKPNKSDEVSYFNPNSIMI